MQNQDFTEAKVLPFVETTSKELHDLLQELKFNKDNPQHLYAICLFCSILSIVQSCILLIKSKHWAAFPVLLRSLVEAHVDLLNGVNDTTYFKRMYLSYLTQKRKLLKNAKENPGNPFFKLIVSSMNLDEEIEKVDKETGRIQTHTIIPLNVWERFSQARLEDTYQFVYWDLCLDTHNNIRALERRHIQKTDHSHEVLLEKDEPIDNWLPYIDSLLGILINSSLKIHSFLESTAESYFEELKSKFENLRGRYPKEKYSTIED